MFRKKLFERIVVATFVTVLTTATVLHGSNSHTADPWYYRWFNSAANWVIDQFESAGQKYNSTSNGDTNPDNWGPGPVPPLN